MTTLHLRKVMLIGAGMGELAAAQLSGLGSRSPMHGHVSDRLVFWIPLPPGHPKRTRDDARKSVVPDVRDFELRALRDGAIEEVVMENRIPLDLPEELRSRAAIEAWERLTKSRMGVLPTRGAAPLIATPEAAAREQRRRAIG